MTKFKTIVKKSLEARYQAVYLDLKTDRLRLLIPKNSRWTFSEGEYYEQNVLHWLKKFWADETYGQVFFDIGANIGYYSLAGAKSAHRVYAFEPVKSTLKLLKANIRLNRLKNIRLMSYGISNKNGRASINIYSASGNNSLFARNIPPEHELKFSGQQSIELATVDNLVKLKHLPLPTVLKIDVEGAELPALKGALNTIRQAQPVIVCEYSAETSHDAGYSREDIKKILEKNDYKVLALTGDYKDNKLYNLTGSLSKQAANLVAFPPGAYEKFSD